MLGWPEALVWETLERPSLLSPQMEAARIVGYKKEQIWYLGATRCPVLRTVCCSVPGQAGMHSSTSLRPRPVPTRALASYLILDRRWSPMPMMVCRICKSVANGDRGFWGCWVLVAGCWCSLPNCPLPVAPAPPLLHNPCNGQTPPRGALPHFLFPFGSC